MVDHRNFNACGFFMLMQDDLTLFIPFSKKDDDQHMVYGYASTEALDSQGEVVEKGAIEAALPDYMRFGNIREMHQPSAVGKTKSAIIDKKGLFIGAKIIDKGAWEKVKEGVYNGFSIGGRKVAQVANKIKRLALSEISIVDRPANPEALFSLVKFDKAGVPEETVSIGKPDKKQEQIYSMFDASYLLNMAKELAYMLMQYKAMKKPTGKIESAMNNLKSAASECLGKSEEADFICAILDGATKIEFEDNSIAKADVEFAYIDKTGNKYLSVANKVNLINSIAKFSSIQFDNPEAKKKTAQIIVAKTKELNIKLSENSEVYMSAVEKFTPSPIWTGNWEHGYFSQQREVLG